LKLGFLILAIILWIVSAILFIALAVTLKHTVEILAVCAVGGAAFAASFLPLRS
jgi:hypothetical protein